MPMKIGTRYNLPSGGQILVTKGGDGILTDGDVELLAQGQGEYGTTPTRERESELKLGKRWGIVRRENVVQDDGKMKEVATTFEQVLVIKPGTADLRYNGEPMEEVLPTVLPSAD